ncbi:F0F1 ATP synthase subunit B [Spiroplasma taiwanense]|uniref:ATP synthase subunit b n=1 Tax=Spiroplasma taiwanense CT-1 TaxID=1276220 RepID=S5MFV9_9MOLU|nr:F0F1 ATP synthase subunit B [Spiroplasma taiwanense]AGR40750.1 F0F1 ATP synthase subunit B [Spiroplasma taiwanense CT-1]
MLLFLAEGTAGIPNVVENLFPNLPNFIAHILSTVVIILLLSKLVYKPFRETIKERRRKINELLDEASSKQAIANKNNKEAVTFLDSAKEESKEIISVAKIEADKLKIGIIDDARKEATNIQLHAKQTIEFERKQAQDEIRKEVIDLAFSAAEKLIETNISKDKNQKMIEDFLNSLDK